VTLVSRFSDRQAQIAAAGIATIPFNIGRSGTNPLADVATLFRLWRVYRALAPDIVYQVALKPVLLGSLAARLAGVGRRVDALGGLGFLFGKTTGHHRALRVAARLGMTLLLRGDHTLVQNRADLDLLARAGVPAQRLHLIAGAGVDLSSFQPRPEPSSGPVVVTLVSRMIWDKGVGEFVEAARLLAARGIDTRFRLVGRPDAENPRSIDPEQLRRWDEDGVVTWVGYSGDVASIWAASHIAVLPSYYREGLPKALMEAAACGRPIVTTDLPGCRDAIVPNKSGLLVPARDAESLANAVQTLIEDPQRRRAMGAYARRDAEARFSDDQINGQILDLCDALVGRDGVSAPV
jgi:glycosyltransferase involved in cell wall biosynthesis